MKIILVGAGRMGQEIAARLVEDCLLYTSYMGRVRPKMRMNGSMAAP